MMNQNAIMFNKDAKNFSNRRYTHFYVKQDSKMKNIDS